MKKVKVEDAVGMVLGHDLTKVVPGSYKGPAFRKGHIVREEDIPHLKDIGKEHIYLFELGDKKLHEDDAALAIAQAAAGARIECAPPSEGRVNLKAQADGLLKVNRSAVDAVNNVEHIALSTRHSNQLVKAGDVVAAVKIIPLVVDKAAVQGVEANLKRYGEVLAVHPLAKLKVAAVITGNEVFYGRIEDRFAKQIADKVAFYGGVLQETLYRPDDPAQIAEAIVSCRANGAEIVIASGGMSVDPDDVTPEAIRATGADVVTYGTPVLPGAMFMLAYLEEIAIIGLPACGMFAKTTVLDLVLPRILAGERLSKNDIVSLGYGGLCSQCEQCVYPHCPFGK
ncbi:molybdopterin-binding protein [Azotosporobacter soli]|uniref:molybdopterin-binding protein n=1 Tax=Azotosporobacter soli TaxID=3055040 RepID=UPI0031FE8B76